MNGPTARTAPNHRLLLPTIAAGTMLAPLNSTMIAVALPDIQRDFGTSVTSTSWLVTIYLIAMAVGQPIGGRLGDLHGRRPVYLIGLAWFALASIGCALAPGLAWLIVFRVQQALAGTLVFPNSAAIVREAIPEGRRGMAFGIVGLCASAAAALGPPIGGVAEPAGPHRHPPARRLRPRRDRLADGCALRRDADPVAAEGRARGSGRAHPGRRVGGGVGLRAP